MNPVLNRAELLMTERPDSALSILEAIASPDELSKHEYAVWCLLITQARDKNYVNQTSDSIISIAANYFERGNNLERKAQAFYYKGRVNEEIGRIDEALLNYLKARDYVVGTKDFHLRGLIQLYIGNLQWKLADNENALVAYRNSYSSFLVEGDTVNCAFLMRNMGRVYTDISYLDSAEVYLKESLNLMRRAGLTPLQSSIENDLAILYEKNGKYRDALNYAISSVNNTIDELPLRANYLMIGSIYHKMGEIDSSCFYLKKALDSENLYTLAEANRLLGVICKEKKDFVQGEKYLTKYISYRDSIEQQYNVPKLKELEMLYQTEKTAYEKERLMKDKRIMQLLFVSALCAGLFLIISGYLLYQSRLKRKEQQLQSTLEMAKDYQYKYVAYQKEIENKELELNTLIASVKEKESVLSGHEEKYLISINLEEDIEELKKKIENLKNDISVLSKKNSNLMDILLNGSELKAAVEETLEKNQSMTPELWLGIQKKIKEIDPDFLRKVKKVAPELKQKELQLCCLVKLNVPIIQIALLLRVDKRTISKYKSVIVKERFGRQESILLDTLLHCL